MRLPGHVLAILRQATPVALAPGAGAEPITLMIALNRADQAGFDRYLRDVYDPHSPNFRRFLSQPEITARFGPTQDAYDDVLAYLQQQGFTLVQGSANRLTLTVRGTRAQAERAFGIRIREFTTGARRFFANEEDPTLPAHLGSHVQAVVGLSDFGQPRGAQGSDPSLVQTIASSFARGAGAGLTLIGLSIEQVAALCESDPVLAELLRRAGSALSLLVAVQSASAMLSPPKPSK